MRVHVVSVIQKGIVEKGQNIEGWLQVDMSIMVEDSKPNENFKMDWYSF